MQVGADIGHLPAQRRRRDRGQFDQHGRIDIESGHVEVLRARHQTDGAVLRADAPGAALEHPVQHAQVVPEARPEVLAGRVLAEPVDVEDARRVRQARAGLQPVREVVAEVVAGERLHGHRVATHDADIAGGRGGGFGGDRGGHQHAVLPAAGLVDERRQFAPASAEYQGRRSARRAGPRRPWL